jgi:hypothetical protein
MTRDELISDYFAEIGRKGGQKHSVEHMAELGRRSAAKRAQNKENQLSTPQPPQESPS